MLGQMLVTKQTGPEGKLVSKVLVAEAVDITRELYFAVLLDRGNKRGTSIMASTEGGMDIEEVAAKTPEKIFKESIHPPLGFSLPGPQDRRGARADGPLINQAVKLFTRAVPTLHRSATAR